MRSERSGMLISITAAIVAACHGGQTPSGAGPTEEGGPTALTVRVPCSSTPCEEHAYALKLQPGEATALKNAVQAASGQKSVHVGAAGDQLSFTAEEPSPAPPPAQAEEREATVTGAGSAAVGGKPLKVSPEALELIKRKGDGQLGKAAAGN